MTHSDSCFQAQRRVATYTPRCIVRGMLGVLVGVLAGTLGTAWLPARAAAQDPAATPLARSYGEHCAHCHSGGAPSAPRLGDTQAWRLRAGAGLNTLYRSAIEGIPNTAMFAKGGHKQLSDDEIRRLVDYMLQASGVDQPLLLAAQRYDALGLTQREFIALDQDRNGELDANELAQDTVLVAALPRFDGDGNGRLSEREFVRMLQTLANERMAQRRADADLLRQIQQRLSQVAGMPAAGIKLSARDGAVVVAGMVRDAQLARQAYTAIRWTPGLRSLDNRLMPAEILLFD